MRQLSDSTGIDSPPEPIWAWLASLSKHCTEWHADRISADWERGEPNQVG
jgi:hypothetical protein